MGTPESTIPCVGAVVHDSSGRLLLIRRGHPPAAGRWSLPGGRVEAGETDSQALVREMREETGLDVELADHVGTVHRGRYEIRDYRCHVVAGMLHAGDDAADVRWVDSAQYRTLEDAGQLVDDLTATLCSWDCLPRES